MLLSRRRALSLLELLITLLIGSIVLYAAYQLLGDDKDHAPCARIRP